VELNDWLIGIAIGKARAVWKEDTAACIAGTETKPNFSMPDMNRVYDAEIRRLKESDSE
jgi:hypothetical protein